MISSSIATIVGLSIRMFFLGYLGVDLLNFNIHPILSSINLFSFNSIRIGLKSWIEAQLLPNNLLMMDNITGDGSTSTSTAPSSPGSTNCSPVRSNTSLGVNGPDSDTGRPINFHPSEPRVFDYLDPAKRARILDCDNRRVYNSKRVDPKHTPRTLGWRVHGYKAKAELIYNRYDFRSISGQALSNAIMSYNNLVVSAPNRPYNG